MKIVQVHNRYRYGGGETDVFLSTFDLLKRNGITVDLLEKKSEGLDSTLFHKLNAFISGIYSFSAAREMNQMISQNRPDLVHIHNLYPLLSPSVLVSCRRAGIPVVMTCHNYRLICPVATLFSDGKICERCVDGKEYWCVLKNCRGDFSESVAYAFRSVFARSLGLFKNNVTIYIAVSEYVKNRLVSSGLDKDLITVIPNMVNNPKSNAEPINGKYVAYIGRISEEKGIKTLLAATSRRSNMQFLLAGNGPLLPAYKRCAPKNANFVGWLNKQQLSSFYREARFIVVPSEWYETFGLVAVEAMSHGLPVIASRIGGLPELVEDGVTGLLFEPGNSEELSSKMKLLWDNPDLCKKMGQAGREKAIRDYNKNVYYKRLTAAYKKAIDINIA